MLVDLQFHVESPTSCSIPFTGPSLRAAFLKMVHEHSPELGDELHHGQGSRPYSIDPFPFDRQFRTHLTAGEMYTFSVRIMDSDDLSEHIRNMALRQSQVLQVQGLEFPIRSMDFRRWDPKSLWDELALIPEMKDGERINIHMSFLTPTQLSQFDSDMVYLLPDPEKIFSSTLRLWNLGADDKRVEPISDYRHWVQRNIFVSRHHIRTRRVLMGPERPVVGFLGDVTFTMIPEGDLYSSLTPVLARFSELTNIGKNRTAGFGKVNVTVAR